MRRDERSVTQDEHPYASFIQNVQKPSQYLGGDAGEKKKPWNEAVCRICLAFPDLYEVGMSHLGTKILYSLLNAHPKLLAERSYAVWGDMEHELRSRGEPLRSLESARPLRAFDVVGFSLQFELTYTNVLQMLELGGIPLLCADRAEDDPLVIAGGPSATHPEVLAPIVDVFLIGDGEEKTPELLLAYAAMRDAGVPRATRIAALAKLGGLYVPAAYPSHVDEETGLEVVDAPRDPEVPYPVRRTWLADLSKFPFPHDAPIASTETVFDRVAVEIARGCTEGCRFCQAGMIYRPVRERDPKQVIATIVRAVTDAGYDEASLTSLSTADYSAIAPLVEQATRALEGTNVTLSVSSLRAYGLPEAVLDDLATQRAGGLTFAPEAGTQRMRDVVNKNVTEAQLLETAERVFSRGWSKMKLYFMIGLPTEEDEDVIGIVETGRRAHEVGQRFLGRRGPRVTVSVSTHVPKPHTPFQWCATNPNDEVLRKQRLLRDAARGTGIKLRMHDAAGTWLEGVLARGDRKLSNVLLRAFALGARFDSWESELDVSVWRRAFEEHGVRPEDYLGTLPVTARLPWDHIDVGLEPGFLAREYRRALANRLSPPCGKAVGQFVHATNVLDAKADHRRLVCYDCGVACDLDQMRDERLVALRRLGADEPREPHVVSERPALERRVMRAVDQGPRTRIRLRYTKLGRLAFTAHLDLARTFPRIFRRADLPTYSSEGYSPSPLMTFGPALSLGVSSLAEYVDVTLRARDLQPDFLDDLHARLARASFDGLEVRGVVALAPDDAGIQHLLAEAEYVAGVPDVVLASLGIEGETGLARRIAERRAEGGLVVRRDHRGIGKLVDVSAALVEVEPGVGAAALAEAGISGRLVPVRFVVRLDPRGTAKAAEVMRALLGADELEARFVRTGLFARDATGRLDPLDLLRARQAHRVSLQVPTALEIAP